MTRPSLAATAFAAALALALPAAAQPPAKGAQEGTAVSLRELKAVIDKKDAKELFGAARLVGFMLAEDARGKDCVLVFAHEKGQPPLRLDDLAGAHRNAEDGAARPACTIDPRAEILKQLGEISGRIGAAREPAGIEKHIAEWRKVAVSAQDVRVFNVPASTHFAKTIVDADYLLKSICDGTEAVKGVTVFSDRVAEQAKERIAKTGALDAPLDGMSRFLVQRRESRLPGRGRVVPPHRLPGRTPHRAGGGEPGREADGNREGQPPGEGVRR